MILTGSEIERQVRLNRITLDPFDPAQLNPNSYNYRIGTTYKMLPASIADPQEALSLPDLPIPESGVVLRPGQLYLASTYEVIGSTEYVPSLIGRSSMGRLGLYLQVSADLGQLGTCHHWTLELVVAQPLRIYPCMKIGQVSFWVPYGEKTMYQGRYHRQADPGESKLHLDFAESERCVKA